MSGRKHVFISYSHKDQEWCDLFVRQLKAVHDPLEFEVWVDKNKVRLADQWQPEIERGLDQADLALLLVSDHFFSSAFINAHEQPRLLRRRAAGLLVVPVLVGPFAWQQIKWLKETELRPRGGQALELLGRPDSPQVKEVVAQLVDEITTLLKSSPAAEGAALPAPRADAQTHDHELPQALVRHVLLGELDDDAAAALAARLVSQVAQFSNLRGAPLLRAVRLFVEFHLLRSREPTSPLALLQSLDLMPADHRATKLLNELKRGAGNGDYSQCVIDANSMFFMLARDREPMWKAYFEWLHDHPDAEAGDPIGTLATVNVLYGFIAPQFLVAGLMSHFDDDWRPVLSAYAREAPDPDLPGRGFGSLQASQWNLWLVWGPSIPICRCEQWRGLHAFQYGFGDENNSLPLLELEDDGQGLPKTLAPLVGGLLAARRGAAPVNLAGRLRWGSHFLHGSQAGSAEAAAAQPLIDADPSDDDDLPARPLTEHLMADAQAALFCGAEPLKAHQSDGLILQLSRLQKTSNEPRAYFSAYLWMMFLVAGPAEPGGDVAGPRLLWHRSYPDWPEAPQRRDGVRQAKMWRNLLPIFVHANIADPAALGMQRRMLVQSALAMLRQLWAERASHFDADDVRNGIRFHLVCASDYPGCGEAVRYPTGETLSDLMRQALVDEPERELASVVLIPPADERADERPWGLRGYFSACHLPELVLDYFDHVRQLQPKPARR